MTTEKHIHHAILAEKYRGSMATKLGVFAIAIHLFFVLPLSTAQSPHQIVELHEMVPPNWTVYAPSAQKWKEYLILSDTYNNRVVILDNKLGITRQIGQIGQDPGNLFQPFDIAVDNEGNIYILDDLGKRIQVFDWNGHLLSQITSTATISGISVNSHGEIFVSRPYSGHLVEVLDRHGVLLRSFGTMRKISDFYGDEMRASNDRFGPSVNRCKIAFDAQDNVYVGFEAAPEIQKYDKSGHLIFDKPLAGVEADIIRSTFRTNRKSPIGHGYWGDGVAPPYVLSGMVIDQQTGDIWVSLLWDRCWLYHLNSSADTIKVLDMPRKNLLLQKLAYDQDQRVLLSAVLSSRNTSAIYEINQIEPASGNPGSIDNPKKQNLK